MVSINTKSIKDVYFEVEMPLAPPDHLVGKRIKKCLYEPYIPIYIVKNEAKANLLPSALSKMPIAEYPKNLPAPTIGGRIEDILGLQPWERACYEYEVDWDPGRIRCSNFYMELDVSGINFCELMQKEDKTEDKKTLVNIFRYWDLLGVTVETNNYSLTHGKHGKLFCIFEYAAGSADNDYLESNGYASLAFTPNGNLAVAIGSRTIDEYFAYFGYGRPVRIRH